ncbi:hypothetical protein BKI52_02195 [marine bacterium AO1-C]|nr:hypothetical protein BKI52_02195 [marine bacterium AO1-C]
MKKQIKKLKVKKLGTLDDYQMQDVRGGNNITPTMDVLSVPPTGCRKEDKYKEGSNDQKH